MEKPSSEDSELLEEGAMAAEEVAKGFTKTLDDDTMQKEKHRESMIQTPHLVLISSVTYI